VGSLINISLHIHKTQKEGNLMAEPLDSKKVTSIEELIITNTHVTEVLIEVCAMKGIISKEKV
jgi:hypothetical protein